MEKMKGNTGVFWRGHCRKPGPGKETMLGWCRASCSKERLPRSWNPDLGRRGPGGLVLVQSELKEKPFLQSSAQGPSSGCGGIGRWPCPYVASRWDFQPHALPACIFQTGSAQVLYSLLQPWLAVIRLSRLTLMNSALRGINLSCKPDSLPYPRELAERTSL